MKWSKVDLDKYVQAKEYIDTLLIPLIPFQLAKDNDLAKEAFQRESLEMFLHEIEKELMGRVLLMPSYNYLKGADKEDELKRIHSIIEDASEQPFQHIFYITTDASWKKEEKNLDGELIWWPSVNEGDIHSEETRTAIRNQVNQVSELIRTFW